MSRTVNINLGPVTIRRWNYSHYYFLKRHLRLTLSHYDTVLACSQELLLSERKKKNTSCAVYLMT